MRISLQSLVLFSKQRRRYKGKQCGGKVTNQQAEQRDKKRIFWEIENLLCYGFADVEEDAMEKPHRKRFITNGSKYFVKACCPREGQQIG